MAKETNVHDSKRDIQALATSLIRQYQMIISVGLLLVFCFTIGSAFYLSNQLEQQVLNEENYRAQQALQAINQTISVSIFHVDKMRAAMEAARSTPELSHNASVIELIQQQAQGSPATAPLQTLPEELKSQLGQLYVREQAQLAADDLLPLLSMLPSVVSTHTHSSEFQWSYYYDAQERFSLLYPGLPMEVLLQATGSSTMDEALDVVYDAGGTFPVQLVSPEQNPDRAQAWTTPYLDAAGKGMMVSLLAPVYEAQTFIGVVGADITLKVLDNILINNQLLVGRMVLVDQNGLVVADSGQSLQGAATVVNQAQVLSLATIGEAHRIEHSEVNEVIGGRWASYQISDTPWRLVTEVKSADLRGYVNDAIFPYILLGVVFAVLLVLSIFYQHKNFSKPALQLAKYVEELSSQTQSAKTIDVPIVPERWRFWFSLVTTVEQERQAHLTTINQYNEQLEVRVAERTEALQQALDELTAAKDDLVRAEKLASLGSLVAGVAHELNTPIGNGRVIATFLRDMTASFEGKLAQGKVLRSDFDNFIDQSKEAANSIELNLTKAAELISSFKQVATDQASYQRRPFDLRVAVHELGLTMNNVLHKQKVKLVQQVDEGIELDSYPGPLSQVLMNLVTNTTVHAFADQVDNQVTISGSHNEQGQVVISVRDNGIGISDDHIAKVFDPFFTTKLGQGGSGLGLNIVYNLVSEILGGEIMVSSVTDPGAANTGTTFTIVLPSSAPLHNALT